MDFGPFAVEGLLLENYLRIAGTLDAWGWWPPRLDGMTVADVGCFSGGLSLLMAHRAARHIYAVDELPEHLEQCALTPAPLRSLPSSASRSARTVSVNISRPQVSTSFCSPAFSTT
jgi:SAM-dependent methyltransferase